MRVECVFFGGFREAVGEKTVSHETDAETVDGLLHELEAAYPALAGALLDDDAIVGNVAVTVDGTHVQQLDGPATHLDADSVVRITQAIHGG